MPILGIMHFDDTGQIHRTDVELTRAQLEIHCWLPARFLGGMCDRSCVCRYAKRGKCKAGAS
jgi:hypothetical protein